MFRCQNYCAALYYLILPSCAPPPFQNYEAETSALLFWQYLVCVVTIPPYLSFYLWIVGKENIAVATT